jgi:hypothetical protein
MPRIACSALTTGAQRQSGTSAAIARVSRSRQRGGDRRQVIVDHDAVRRMLPSELLDPREMSACPTVFAEPDAPVPQQQRLQVLAMAPQFGDCLLASAHQIAHRFVRRVRHPYQRQFAGAIAARQGDGVAPVGLHPLARPTRDQRRRRHHAVVPERRQLPVEPITTWPRLVAKAQLAVGRRQFLRQPRHRRRLVGDAAQRAHDAVASRLRHRNRDCLLVRIQSDVSDTLVHGPSPVLEARRRPIRRNPRLLHVAGRAASSPTWGLRCLAPGSALRAARG